jgi:mono/diheme cytochrome c family protein
MNKPKMHRLRNIFAIGAAIASGMVLLVACGKTTQSQSALLSATEAPPIPTLTTNRIAQGQPLYEQHCATCHGLKGEGQPDWKVRKSDGSLPAPPHNNSGHTWHHADELLFDLVANGSSFPQSTMPTFGDQLSEAEIVAIFEYIKTWWGPDERAFQWQVTWQTQQQQR